MKPPYALDLETTSVDPVKGSVLSCGVSDGEKTVSWWIESPNDLKQVQEVFNGDDEGRRMAGNDKGTGDVLPGRNGDGTGVQTAGTGDVLRSEDGTEVQPPIGDPRRDRREDPVEVRETRLVVHHVPMEGLWAELFFGFDVRKLPSMFIDTALLAFRVDPGQPMKLASVVARHLPEYSGWKTETESLLVDNASMLQLPREEVLKRNAIDAFVTRKLYDILWNKLSKEEQDIHEEDVAISLLNARMSRRGMLLDTEKLIEARRDLTATILEVTRIARSICGDGTLNPGSTQQVAQILQSKGVPLPSSDGGGVSTDEITLRAITYRPDQDPEVVAFIRSIIGYRKAQKILSTYVTGYASAREYDGRVRSSLFWPGTVTARPASYEPNLLNVPRKGVRQMFTAPPGMSVMEIDLAQAELRVSGALSGDDLLLRAYRRGGEGLDLHTRRAQAIYGKDLVSKDERYVGKKINFSTEYGASTETLWESLVKEDVNVSPALVEKGRSSFWQDHQGLQGYIRRVEDRALTGETIYAPTGAYKWTLQDMQMLHPKNQGEAVRSIFNATIQCVPPRLMYRVALILEQEIEIVLMTYDGIIAYVPTDFIKDVYKRVTQVVEDVMSRELWLGDVELPADAKAGVSWGELKEIK